MGTRDEECYLYNVRERSSMLFGTTREAIYTCKSILNNVNMKTAAVGSDVQKGGRRRAQGSGGLVHPPDLYMEAGV